MGQNLSLNKSAILYEIVQSVIKKKTQDDADKNSIVYQEDNIGLNIENFILENEKLQESLKQKSDEIEALRKELQKYSASLVHFQNQECQFDCLYIENVSQIIDSNQVKLFNLLDKQNTPKSLVKDEKLNLNIDLIHHDNFSKQALKQEVENIFFEMKTAIESVLKNQLKSVPFLNFIADSQLKCKISDDAFQYNFVQKQSQTAPNQEIYLNPYHNKELNKSNYLNQEIHLNTNSPPQSEQIENIAQSQNQKLLHKISSSCQKLEIKKASELTFLKKENNQEIQPKSLAQLDQKNSKEIDNSSQEDSEDSSESDLKNSEDKDLYSETSISSHKEESSNNENHNSFTKCSRGESEFQRILMMAKLKDNRKEINEAINCKDIKKLNNIKNHNEGHYHMHFKTENTLSEKQGGELIQFHKKKLKNQNNKRPRPSIIFSRCPSKKFSNISQKSFFYLENLEKIKLQSQTDFQPQDLSPIHHHHDDSSQNSTQITSMDFCEAKLNIEVLKVVDQIDQKNFFSDEVVKYSSNRKSEQRTIVLNSYYFYVFSQDPLEKHKQFLIEDISKIEICPNNNQLCSIQIKKQFQLIIEVPHIEFFIQHIQNHFKNVLKKNSPEIKFQRTAIYTNNCRLQSDVIAQKFLDEQRCKQELTKSQSDQKSQLKTDSAQLNFKEQKNHCFKAFITKNPNKLLQYIQNENWVEGFLILEKDKSDSAVGESIFQTAEKLEVQAKVDCFISNQKIFQFIDNQSNNYFIKLKQDFDIPILNKNINCGYKQYLNLSYCFNS
ncbi:hypothetical protein TTHERM_00122120 (macronuclear) [Tetrahymena thermophila SB210]|uniref:Uncharacterized protein n=1 Tax=Tetrahymena thermophila (strain SB210) TaxID=312017 RepID=Q22YV8_TETTS|nr:hypothetical protein TTHERM_00122120 [Tetrahymena thermophila SB210]EAR90563.3 hypothetical protein TTHERM_00122120 [Tetrahymena thermophila SB210]|eukprot:XP_001010808.3 hypothetical protein TTHERM_00122120 [Tetrahymena thermophila SB210]